MAITCICPKCERFCGFKETHAGRQARCLTCSCHFIVPDHDGQKAKIVKSESESALPGFYRAALVDSFKVFIQKDSLFGIILCFALTGFHFFVGNTDYSVTLGRFRPPLIIGWFATFCCAGYLLWYFMETAAITVMNEDFLPEISIGAGFAFIGEAVKAIYLFIAAFAIAAIPGVVLSILLDNLGISYSWLSIILLVVSLSMLPMLLCMFAAGTAPWRAFRYDRIIYMMLRTFGPYALTTVITVAALISIFYTIGFFATAPGVSTPLLPILLCLRITAVFMMLFAMRVIGLYGRHYCRCFPEFFAPDITTAAV